MKNKTLREEFEKKFKGDIGVSLAGLGQTATIDGSLEEVWKWFESKLTQREAEVRKEFKRFKARKYIDATPDGNYVLRILEAYRQDSNLEWSDNTGGLKIKNPLLKELNKIQKQRAKELDKAINYLKSLTQNTK